MELRRHLSIFMLDQQMDQVVNVRLSSTYFIIPFEKILPGNF